MIIEIPDELVESFKQFLDIAQSSFTENEVEQFSDSEKAILEWVEEFLGEEKSFRFESYDEKRKAARQLAELLLS